MKSVPSLLSLLSFIVLGTAASHELQLSLEVHPGFDIDLSAQRLIEFDDHQRVWMTELEKVSNFQGYNMHLVILFRFKPELVVSSSSMCKRHSFVSTSGSDFPLVQTPKI